MPQIARVEPRSTWIHWGSLNWLDQRVPVLPSKAAEAGKLAFSSDEAVAGWFSATFVVPQVAAWAGSGAATSAMPASNRVRRAATGGRRPGPRRILHMVTSSWRQPAGLAACHDPTALPPLPGAGSPPDVRVSAYRSAARGQPVGKRLPDGITAVAA